MLIVLVANWWSNGLRHVDQMSCDLQNGGEAPRLIDEWQREPRVWDAVRREVDVRRSPGQFILTSSATPRDQAVRHSGAGRMSVVTLRPMTLFEQGYSPGTASLTTLLDGQAPPATTSALDVTDYAERIVVGGWPGRSGSGSRDCAGAVR